MCYCIKADGAQSRRWSPDPRGWGMELHVGVLTVQKCTVLPIDLLQGIDYRKLVKYPSNGLIDL